VTISYSISAILLKDYEVTIIALNLLGNPGSFGMAKSVVGHRLDGGVQFDASRAEDATSSIFRPVEACVG
jgi:hypothetical protein